MRGGFILASLLVGSGAVAFAACSNAYVGVDPESADASVEASVSSSDADVPDVLVAVDAADAADAADAGDPCDKDNDGYLARACDGSDCDDTDPRAHPDPDAGFLTSVISAVTSGDWNCDGVVTKQLPYNVTCSSLLLGENCAMITGFSGDPACGAQGDYVTCKALSLGCTVDPTKTVKLTQGCR